MIYEAEAGENIHSCIRRVLAIPRTNDVQIKFNDYLVRVYPDSCEDDLYEKYRMIQQINQLSRLSHSGLL